MIVEVEGDILLSKAQVIAHGVAPHDDFNQGLAFSLKERWPALYRDFKHYCHLNNPSSGGLWTWQGASPEGGTFSSIQLFTQDAADHKGGHPARASLSNVNHTLRELHKEVKAKNIKTVAMTRLATGVGGLSWDEVKPLVEKHFPDNDITVYVYTKYHKDVPAVEKVLH